MPTTTSQEAEVTSPEVTAASTGSRMRPQRPLSLGSSLAPPQPRKGWAVSAAKPSELDLGRSGGLKKGSAQSAPSRPVASRTQAQRRSPTAATIASPLSPPRELQVPACPAPQPARPGFGIGPEAVDWAVTARAGQPLNTSFQHTTRSSPSGLMDKALAS